MDLVDLLPRSDEDKFLHLPYAERLKELKSTIVQLYMGNYGPGGRHMTMRQVTELMKEKFSFYMSQNQLEHTLRKWNVRRRILKREKDDVIVALETKARAGTKIFVSDITLQEGKSVDKKQIERYLQAGILHKPMVPGVLSSWNLPYAAFTKSTVSLSGTPSISGESTNTPNYTAINSHIETNILSPLAVSSPFMTRVQQRFKQIQSNLLLQGHFTEFFMNCKREEHIILINHFHETWMHIYVIAKHWGRGPLSWTKEMVSTVTLGSSAATCPNHMSPITYFLALSTSSCHEPVSPPQRLCEWVVHMDDNQLYDNYQGHPDYQGYRNHQVLNNSGIKNGPQQKPWSRAKQKKSPFLQSMKELAIKAALTSLTSDDLPISSQLIAESLRMNPDPLQQEALKFGIMSGNVALVESLLGAMKKIPNFQKLLKEIHPYYIAVSYLDGGYTCCSMLSTLKQHLLYEYPINTNNADNMGHTILDGLVISIIRSHTDISPNEVSSGFAHTNLFPGEEKDACGRWDADSPAVRQLFQNGNCRIPLSWKHPFCHSSVQAVCHSIIAIFPPGSLPSHLNHLSGLFKRYCNICGGVLSIGPLHSVIILAYYLAESGVQGETLFGAIAVIVCLLRLGANIVHKAKVSVDDILGSSLRNACHHSMMDAEEFIQEIPQATVRLWSPECQIGWHCICGILRLAKDNVTLDDSMDIDQDIFNIDHTDDELDDCDDDDGESMQSEISEYSCELNDFGVHAIGSSFPCGNPELGLIWAAIQVEILTYRKTSDYDPWISNNFSMAALAKWLDGESGVLEMPLMQMEIMKERTVCGWFGKPFDTNSLPIPIKAEKQSQKSTSMKMKVYHKESFQFMH